MWTYKLENSMESGFDDTHADAGNKASQTLDRAMDVLRVVAATRAGGANACPREIEEKILTHGAITEVALVGVPDPKWGEVGIAVCVARAGARIDESQVRAWTPRRIARYKLPKKVFFWDALPESGYGKVPKKMVKDELHRRALLATAEETHA